MIIYHIISKQDWQNQLTNTFYTHPSLELEGFIHCSKDMKQVGGVVDRYFQNQQDLLLLHIDTNKLISELKFELAPSINEEFPHIFGTINKDAIKNISSL